MAISKAGSNNTVNRTRDDNTAQRTDTARDI